MDTFWEQAVSVRRRRWRPKSQATSSSTRPIWSPSTKRKPTAAPAICRPALSGLSIPVRNDNRRPPSSSVPGGAAQSDQLRTDSDPDLVEIDSRGLPADALEADTTALRWAIHEPALKMLGDSMIGFKALEENCHRNVSTSCGSQYAAIGGGAGVRSPGHRSECPDRLCCRRTACVNAENARRRVKGQRVTKEGPMSMPAGPRVGTISSSGQHHLKMPTALRIGVNPSNARLIAKTAKCTETGQLLSGAVFDCRAVYFAVS